MATLDAPAPVNLVRSIFLCNIFNFFFSAGKACLIPFLTIYMKMLGLTATQTGLIISLKTVISLVFAPLWARCAVRCGRRRCMLMFSLFMMSTTYLTLTAVPSIDEKAFASPCKLYPIDTNFNFTEKPSLTSPTGTKAPVVSTITHLTTPEKSKGLVTGPSINVTGGHKLSNDTNVTTEGILDMNIETTTEHMTTSRTTTVSLKDQEVISVLTILLKKMGLPEEKLKGASKNELESIVSHFLSGDKENNIVADALERLPDDVSEKLFAILAEEAKEGKQRRKRESDEGVSSHEKQTKEEIEQQSWASWAYQELNAVRQHMRETKDQVFLVVLVILMVGETFSAPVEKIADDGWFEFLDNIDDLEKYGMQRIWSTCAYILLPVIITLSVDNTSCVFGLSVHPFKLHFIMFGVMLGIAFLISFFYPLATSDKFKYATKVVKGMRVVCCTGRSFLFVLTLLLMGIVYASYYNFLFWHLLDMGSKEVTLGLCVTMAALSEIPMLLFSEKLVQKIGNGGVVAISILLVGVRCIYYSFLPTPWAVIPAELTHSFTHTALWWAILSSSNFNTSPALSRSIRSILSSVYFGIGFAVGSVVSGVVYDIYGAAILFQAGAIIAFAWFPFLCVCIRCCREESNAKVKYTRLLAAEDASDDTDSMEDDWLEQALKDK